MDINKMAKQTYKKKKKFYLILGDRCHVIIYNFSKPVGEKKHEETIYYLYEGRMITRNNRPIIPGRHIIQIPAKTAWFQLYYMLKDEDRLEEENIKVTFIKKSYKEYDITIHDKK